MKKFDFDDNEPASEITVPQGQFHPRLKEPKLKKVDGVMFRRCAVCEVYKPQSEEFCVVHKSVDWAPEIKPVYQGRCKACLNKKSKRMRVTKLVVKL